MIGFTWNAFPVKISRVTVVVQQGRAWKMATAASEGHSSGKFRAIAIPEGSGRMTHYLCRTSSRHAHWARERSVGLAAADSASLTADQLPCL